MPGVGPREISSYIHINNSEFFTHIKQTTGFLVRPISVLHMKRYHCIVWNSKLLLHNALLGIPMAFLLTSDLGVHFLIEWLIITLRKKIIRCKVRAWQIMLIISHAKEDVMLLQADLGVSRYKQSFVLSYFTFFIFFLFFQMCG